MKSTLFLTMAILVAAPLLDAGYGSESPRLKTLYASFIAPCCWRENLTVHESPAAEKLRTEIAAMVQAGSSDDEIKAALVREYGKRILALPEGDQRLWLFATPVAVVVLGAVFLMLALKRMRERAVTAVP